MSAFRWQSGHSSLPQVTYVVYGCFTHLRIVHPTDRPAWMVHCSDCPLYAIQWIAHCNDSSPAWKLHPTHSPPVVKQLVHLAHASTLIHAVVASIWGVRLGWLGRMHPHWSMGSTQPFSTNTEPPWPNGQHGRLVSRWSCIRIPCETLFQNLTQHLALAGLHGGLTVWPPLNKGTVSRKITGVKSGINGSLFF